ncbi:unnamed protein product, partial [marine sediment metagenome]
GMDQFWSTLAIYPGGISPSSGEKILKWRKWDVFLFIKKPSFLVK